MSVDFSGIWKADLGRSKILGPAPTAIEVTIAHSDPELRSEMAVTKLDGREERVVFTCYTNGQPGKSQLGGKAVDGSARWEGDQLVIKSRIRVGMRELNLCDHWSVSPDGNTLTMEHRDGDLAGQKTVFDRA